MGRWRHVAVLTVIKNGVSDATAFLDPELDPFLRGMGYNDENIRLMRSHLTSTKKELRAKEYY